MIQHERLNKLLEVVSNKLSFIWGQIRNYLFTGVFVLVPVAVTLGIIYFLFQYTDSFLGDVFGARVPGAGLFFTALICLIIGVIAQNIVGKKIIAWMDVSLQKIPVVKSVYSGIKQLADVFLKDQKSSFKRVVMLEYPKENCWVIGFVTSDFYIKIDADIPEKNSMVTVFVPTTPNPTSGFLLILPKSKIVDTNIDIEDAMKVIISGGIVQPNDDKKVIAENTLGNEKEAIDYSKDETKEIKLEDSKV